LTAALDVNAGGELAVQLRNLYEYICKEIVLANVQNNVERLDACMGLLDDLRSAWLEIGTANTQ